MKLLSNIFCLFFVAARLCTAESGAQKSAALLLSPETQTAEGRVAVEKLKADMALQGLSVAEISADEAQDVNHAAALNGGGPVITTEIRAGKLEFKIQDGASGADITKSFNSKQEAPKAALNPGVKAVAAPVEQKPDPAASSKDEKPTGQPMSGQNKVFRRNHIGFSFGMSDFKKNKDSLEILADNTPGGETRYTTTSGRFMLFYEWTFLKKYALGIAGGLDKGGGVNYSNSGRDLSVEAKPKTATLYLMRKFGSHFGIYAGGGAYIIPFRIFDYGNFAGLAGQNTPFKGQSTAAHAEAGLAFTIKNFSLRFSVRQILAGESGRVVATVNGGKYVLVIKDGATLGTRAADQPFAPGEKLYKADFGGTASAVALTYSFANW